MVVVSARGPQGPAASSGTGESRRRSAAYAVSEIDDAAPEPALVEKFELHADVVGQCALAAAHHDRPQEQMTLVDQP